MNNQRFFERVINGHYNRRIVLFVFDILCFIGVDLFYFLVALRAANSMPVTDGWEFFYQSLTQLGLICAFRIFFGIYQNVWRYSNTKAYFMLVLADALAGLSTLLVVRIINIFSHGFYNGLWQASTLGSLTALLALVSRFVYSLTYKTASKSKGSTPRVPVVIVGAGRLGAYLVGDLRNNPNSGYEPMFFVDTDYNKIGNKVSGLRVYDTATAQQLIRELGIWDVIIAITQKDSEAMAALYDRYSEWGCKVQVYDSLVSHRRGQRGVLREISIEDLLFRKPVALNPDADNYYAGKTVLVTGGGGSIGSELCRQLAKSNPKKLVIFDIYENNAYDIQQELRQLYGDRLDLAVEIGSVRDARRLETVMRCYRPQVVFHAAAHKHVPLMEHSASEAIKNNVFGTYNTAETAEKYGVEKFILISTDKAVNPTNIMGASKRLCEMIVQCRTDSRTSFAAVRFGNVLGSNGSVIPLFKRQIAAGGPVTITDKRIVRYFMTIPEASQLVLQAGSMAQKGELFVLDMGKPVRIYDLALNLIRLSGLEPGVDIAVQEIGLRPGEKLYEELLIQTESLTKTDNDMIFIERDEPLTRLQVADKLAILHEALEESDEIGGDAVKAAIARVVPSYREPSEVNGTAEQAREMQAAGMREVIV
ncbi:MAG: polysaccharide biosynthesis protein [Clostridia bacterium]|nr:polysaccharide biosynthesis protein [Clostridia bacterium]